MAKELNKAPAFDEIVFAKRNKEYGAYKLRKKYKPTLILALFVGIVIIGTVIITPYLNAKASENRAKRAERTVEVTMEAMEAPVEQVAPPPPTPSAPCRSYSETGIRTTRGR
jgi:periplasmic protein TonB